MNRVEEMMDLMKAHDLRELKEFLIRRKRSRRKIIHWYGYLPLSVLLLL